MALSGSMNEYTCRYPLYECFPAVAKVGVRTRVAIVPEGGCRFFRDDKYYEMWVGGMRDDMPDYHKPVEPNTVCRAKDGYLWFDFTFEREMEYSVRFREKGGEYIEMSMYAVRGDLFGLRPLKGDLHTHSYYSDGIDDVAMTAARYRETGYDFYTLTDHNRYYTSKMAEEAYDGVDLGLCFMHGEEVHTPGSKLHIVHIGGNASVDALYINDRANFEEETARIEKSLTRVPEQYRSRIAEAVWACGKIHEFGGIAILAHPYWKSNIRNLSEDFCNLLFDQRIFDAFELVGGVDPQGINMQLAQWQEQKLKGNNISVVGSSDCHNDNFTAFATKFTVVFAEKNAEESIVDAVRRGMSVAGELDGGAVRFYGDYRLVQFAHFLYAHYFEATRRLFAGEGSLMRRYIREEIGKEPLNLLAGEGDKFYGRFYGLAPVITPSERRKAFYGKWRNIQKNEGPTTSGSSLTRDESRNNGAHF